MAIKKIMVVDDSATDRLYLNELLLASGYYVVEAESAEDCLARLAAEAPDLVIMDVIMPGMNGFQATRAITKDPLTAHIPVIVCTGKAQPTDVAWALKMGAKACMVKPLIQAELVAKIKEFG